VSSNSRRPEKAARTDNQETAMQPTSQPPHSTHRPARRRVQGDQARRRPDHYEVVHRPRRVIRAHDYEALDVDLSQEPSEDTAVRKPRRPGIGSGLAKRLRGIRFGPWEWAGLAASCIACALMVPIMYSVHGDNQMLRNAVAKKETQLAALEKQKREDEKKLAYLQSEKGQEQIQAQRGYLKPGDRILLFPVAADASGDNSSAVIPDENPQ
jgi:hypothetical protein